MRHRNSRRFVRDQHGCTNRRSIPPRAAYLQGLRDSREVWLGNERVADVTTHPAFRAAAGSIATLYDMQHDPAHHDTLCYTSPASGEPVGRSFLIPRSREDLVSRRTMTKTWADATCGMLGRSADFLNTMLTAWAAKAEYFAQQSPACRERVLAYYEHCRERDLFMTHTLIDPQVDRSKNRAEQDDPHLCLGVVDETDEGLIVREAKMIATAAPFAEFRLPAGTLQGKDAHHQDEYDCDHCQTGASNLEEDGDLRCHAQPDDGHERSGSAGSVKDETCNHYEDGNGDEKRRWPSRRPIDRGKHRCLIQEQSGGTENTDRAEHRSPQVFQYKLLRYGRANEHPAQPSENYDEPVEVRGSGPPRWNDLHEKPAREKT